MTQHNELVEKWQREARKNFEPVFSLLDKGDEYIRNSDYDKGLPSSRFLTAHKLDTLISQIIADTERKLLDNVATAIEENTAFDV